jgi:hypothetical protein
LKALAVGEVPDGETRATSVLTAAPGPRREVACHVAQAGADVKAFT